MPVVDHKPFTLPYEPGYTAHWEEAKRRRATRAFLDAAELAQRKSPPITPHLPEQPGSKATGRDQKELLESARGLTRPQSAWS